MVINWTEHRRFSLWPLGASHLRILWAASVERERAKMRDHPASALSQMQGTILGYHMAWTLLLGWSPCFTFTFQMSKLEKHKHWDSSGSSFLQDSSPCDPSAWRHDGHWTSHMIVQGSKTGSTGEINRVCNACSNFPRPTQSGGSEPEFTSPHSEFDALSSISHWQFHGHLYLHRSSNTRSSLVPHEDRRWQRWFE